jgi:hypothetical protein
VAAQSGSNSDEGRRFDDRRWTRGKYTRRAVSWGAFARPTSCEKMEAEGVALGGYLPKQRGKLRDGGWLTAAMRQEEEGVRHGHAVAVGVCRRQRRGHEGGERPSAT